MLTRGERFEDERKKLPEGKNTIAAVSAATDVSASLIQALEDDDNKRDVGYTKVARLADYYGVSANYLLGLSDIATPNTDLQAVCEYTGLSEIAITRLSNEDKDYKQSIQHILNLLIEDDAAKKHEDSILKHIGQYLFLSSMGEIGFKGAIITEKLPRIEDLTDTFYLLEIQDGLRKMKEKIPKTFPVISGNCSNLVVGKDGKLSLIDGSDNDGEHTKDTRRNGNKL